MKVSTKIGVVKLSPTRREKLLSYVDNGGWLPHTANMHRNEKMTISGLIDAGLVKRDRRLRTRKTHLTKRGREIASALLESEPEPKREQSTRQDDVLPAPSGDPTRRDGS